MYVQYNTVNAVNWKFTKQRNLLWVDWAHPCCRCDPGNLPRIYWLNCDCSVGHQSTMKEYKLEMNYSAKHNIASHAGRLPVPCIQEATKTTGSRPCRSWRAFIHKTTKGFRNTLKRATIRVSRTVIFFSQCCWEKAGNTFFLSALRIHTTSKTSQVVQIINGFIP